MNGKGIAQSSGGAKGGGAEVMRTEMLSRHFGGLVAVRDVSLTCCLGELHAVIGPNGAGKTTLINLLSGELAPTSGGILINGEEVTGQAPHRISRRGVGRSYQKTNIFMPFTAYENCRLAAQSRRQSGWAIFRGADAHVATRVAAERALELAGLSDRASSVASALSHGEQRQLEIAMTLATAPRVLLLDEPLAGMGAEESERIVELLRRLRTDHAILLVEHDMDAVFAVADRLTVMVNGAVLASGSAAEIRANRAVQEAYLGEGDVSRSEW